MPIEYKILENKKLIYAMVLKKLEHNEYLQFTKKLYDDVGYKAPMKKIVDYRYCINNAITEQELFQLANFEAKKIAAKCRDENSVIVAPDRPIFNNCLLEESIKSCYGISVAVFRSWNLAVSWLGFDTDDLDLKSIHDELRKSLN